MENQTELQTTEEWFKTALPRPTVKDCDIQLSCLFEEVSEVLAVLAKICDRQSPHAVKPTRDALIAMRTVAQYYRNMAKEMPDERPIIGRVVRVNECEELLDGLADVVVCAQGTAHTQGYALKAALEEVNRSNFSKFENGAPVYDENGKIKKGRNYRKPKLLNYIGVSYA